MESGTRTALHSLWEEARSDAGSTINAQIDLRELKLIMKLIAEIPELHNSEITNERIMLDAMDHNKYVFTMIS